MATGNLPNMPKTPRPRILHRCIPSLKPLAKDLNPSLQVLPATTVEGLAIGHGIVLLLETVEVEAEVVKVVMVLAEVKVVRTIEVKVVRTMVVKVVAAPAVAVTMAVVMEQVVELAAMTGNVLHPLLVAKNPRWSRERHSTGVTNAVDGPPPTPPQLTNVVRITLHPKPTSWSRTMRSSVHLCSTLPLMLIRNQPLYQREFLHRD